MREPPVDNVLVAANYKAHLARDLLLHMSCPQHCQTAFGSLAVKANRCDPQKTSSSKN